MTLIDRFNRKLPYPWRLGLVLLAGLGVWKAAGAVVTPAYLAAVKISGRAPDCSWGSILNMSGDWRKWDAVAEQLRSELFVKASDARAGLTLVHSPERDFWVQAGGQEMDGPTLVAHLLGEHASVNDEQHVAPGEVVIDCGAHIGVFTHKALARGARQVVAVEPHPLNVECLRRNFASEIASGRVVVYPKGVWSSDSVLRLSVAQQNSGMGSVVLERGPSSIEVPLTTLDAIVAEIGLGRVDFIKMDIEGAEREALRGAADTLKRFKPRLMLDSYHLPDDPTVLPAIIAAAQPAYRMRCGACEPVDTKGRHWRPHVLYFY